jgi:hypothetical protein
MKTSLLIAFFACALSSEVCRADSLNAQTEKEIRRELCRLEIAAKQIAQAKQRMFMKSCSSDLIAAAWLGEFHYDPNFYPEGYIQWVSRTGNNSIGSIETGPRPAQ